MNKKELKEKLTELFNNSDKPIQLHDVATQFEIKSNSHDYDLLKKVLDDLVDSEFLNKSARRRYTINKPQSNNLIKGIIYIKNEHGAVVPDDTKISKVSVKSKHILNALDGDEVMVKLFELKKSKKYRGEVVEIVKRSTDTITGKIKFNDNTYFLIPDDEKYYVDFIIDKNNLNGAENGSKVAVKFLSWLDASKSPEAEVIDIIQKSDKPKVHYDSIVKEYNLPKKFSQVSLDMAHSLNSPVDKTLFPNRLDLTDEDVITIDPPDAKDFDDALSLKILPNGNYLLGVHIADVSHYVSNNTPLDEEAQERGNSVYLVDRVVPMLPEELSNEICSLSPNIDRLTFSVMMELTERGALKDYKIKESIIRSKRRFTYDEVLEIIENKEGEFSELILSLHKLAQMLRKKRYSKAGMDFETYEVKFILDDNKYPIKAILKEGSASTSLVEECMLMANKTIAEHITKLTKTKKMKTPLPFLYRVHDFPIPEKIRDVVNLSRTLGYEFEMKNNITSKELNKLIEDARNTPEKYILHQMLIRSMAKAEYSNDNIGHWGLGFKDYAHFTSPIRRYPDLIVHRLLKYYMNDEINKSMINALEASIEELGYHCTATERNAMDAERASVKLAHSVLASFQLGNEYIGTISGIMPFGIFVLLDDLFAEGFINLRDMNDDYYIFEEKNFRLIGKHRKKILQIGKRIKVQISHVNTDKKKIDLVYLGDAKPI